MEVLRPDGAEQLVCTACAHSMPTAEERVRHYLDEWHRYNVKRRCAQLEPISRALYDSKLAAVKAQEDSDRANFSCAPCGKTFGNQRAFQAHVETNKHVKRVANVKEQEARRAAAATVAAAAPASTKPMEVDASGAGAAEEDGDAEEEGRVPVPVGTCLLSGQAFATLGECLDHMLKNYGFYLPYVDNLEDLEGLMEYLGEKVGAAHVCLWCNKTFRSLEAVRKHMVAKSHSKIRMENDEDEEEFSQWYNMYPESDSEEEEEEEEDEDDENGDDEPKMVKAGRAAGTVIVHPSRREEAVEVSHLTEKDELVLTDGTTLGHRANQREYAKYKRPAPRADLVPSRGGLASKLSEQYRAIGLPGYNKQREKGPVPRDVQRRMNKERMVLGVRTNNTVRTHIKSQIDF